MFKWFKNKKKDNKGFTLVELVIVIAILAILVGLLAPQYTKYVEKSRKAADASNMDEMVKVIKVYAADPANELEAGDYAVKITPDAGTTVEVKKLNASAVTETYGKENVDAGLGKELQESIPKWYETKTKSQKWGTTGKSDTIIATVKVGKTTKISAKATPSGKVTYKSSNTKIATVSSKGVVKGKKKGTAKITVTCNGVTKTVKVTVK